MLQRRVPARTRAAQAARQAAVADRQQDAVLLAALAALEAAAAAVPQQPRQQQVAATEQRLGLQSVAAWRHPLLRPLLPRPQRARRQLQGASRH